MPLGGTQDGKNPLPLVWVLVFAPDFRQCCAGECLTDSSLGWESSFVVCADFRGVSGPSTSLTRWHEMCGWETMHSTHPYMAFLAGRLGGPQRTEHSDRQ